MPTIDIPDQLHNRLTRLAAVRICPTTVDQEVELAAEVHLTTWEAFYFGELPHQRPAYHTTETEHD